MAEASSINPEARKYWDLVIEPKSPWLDLRLRELWAYRGMLMLWIKRDYAILYSQTFLGPLWYLIQPVITALAFVLVFSVIARLSTDGIPSIPFYLSGIICWNIFQESVINTSATFQTNLGLFSKVYFPRIIIPLAQTSLLMFKLGIQVLLLFAIVAYYSYANNTVYFTWKLLYLPLIVLQICVLAIGVGLIVAAVTIRYRDLMFVMAFVMQMWMYATPVIYPTSVIPPKILWIINLNPMAVVITLFRDMFFNSSRLGPLDILFSVIGTLLVMFIGLIVFHRNERTFLDTI